MTHRIIYIGGSGDTIESFRQLLERSDREYALEIIDRLAGLEGKNLRKLAHILVVECRLADGSALELLNQKLDVPVLVLADPGDEKMAAEALKKGAYNCIVRDKQQRYLDILGVSLNNAIERHHNEEQLQLFESAVVNANDAILIAELNNGSESIVYVNEAFSKLTGYSLEEVRGESADFLNGPESDRREVEQIRQAMLGQQSVRTELINYTKNGEPFWAEANVVPIRNDKGTATHVVAILRDSTERKQAEEDLIKAKQQAEESKLAKERFLANMSHEIRTPMNGVLGMTNLLLETSLNEEQRDGLNSVRTSAENLLDIINDILDFSKIEAGKLELKKTSFRLDELIDSLVKTLEFKVDEEHVELKSHIDESIPEYLEGDPTRLNQVLLNLAGNAIKFTKEGYVAVEAYLREQDDEQVELEFRVKDTGIGIRKEKLESIFESFTQASSDTSRIYGGTGLGLAIVKQLVLLQGGSVDVKSESGKGSTFIFSLPFKVGRKPEEQKSEIDPAKVDQLKELHLLLVEDNVINRKVALNMLKRWGLQVDIAENGKKALEKVRQQDYDAILMDIQMPEMGGYETTRNIRQLNAPGNEVPIIAMTASALESDIKECFESGMNGYVTKPFKPEDLLNGLINNIFEQETESAT